MGQGDPDIQINIKTSGSAQAKKELQDIAKETKSLGDAYKVAGGGLKGMAAAGKQAAEIYEQLGGGMKGVFGVLLGGGAKAIAIVGTLATVAATAAKALKEFGQAEEGVRKLQAALAQNALLTPEVNKQYQELASTLQEITGKADEEWIDVLNRLTQFGANPGDMQKHVDAVKNLAGILGGDLQSAAMGVSKAMEGSFEMFSRWGIHVDEAATKTEKLDQLYKELAKRGAGQLEAASNSLNGEFKRLTNSVSDLWEALGQSISNTGAVQYVLYGLGKTVAWVAQMMGQTIPVADGMSNALVRSGKAAVDAERFNKNYAESLKEIHDFANAVGDSLNYQIDKMREIARLQDEQTDAQMAQDLALIDREEKQGKLAPDQAIRARSTVRTRSEAQKFKRQQDLRTQQMLTIQQGITAGQDESEEYENTARAAEKEVISEDVVRKRREYLQKKLEGEVQRWKGELEAYRANPYTYSNDEIGVKPGITDFGEEKYVMQTFENKITSAENMVKVGLGRFDKDFPAKAEGTRQRAKLAREEANKVISKNSQNETDMVVQLEKLQREKDAASNVYRTKSGTAAIETATDFTEARKQMGEKTGVMDSPKAVQASTRAVQDEVMRGSGAFVGGLEQLGATLDRNYQHINSALSDLNKRVSTYESQLAKMRNK